MKTQWKWLLLLLLALCFTLSGCRTRITGAPANSGRESETAEQALSSRQGSMPEDGAEEQKINEESGGQTKENPEASRKEYDENAPVEIFPGAERAVHGEGEGGGAFASGNDAAPTVDKLDISAEQTATQTVAAEQAEQMAVSEDAEEADSAMTYFTVLLRERIGSVFECQRQNVYWETPDDHVTVFKTSLEHSLILDAGAYDVSARLLEQNLRVDDGWIGRKNPGVIVKAVDSGVLGTGVFSTDKAQAVQAGLLARDGWRAMDAVRSGRVILLSQELLAAPHLQLSAMLLIAKTAHPDLFSDVDMNKAFAMLAEEATGSIPSGIYWYQGQGGF